MWGGHGYIADNGLEQVYRDVRIAALWEGTTQIQALDLLGRKILLQKLKPIKDHCASLRADVAQHLFAGDAALRGHAWALYRQSFEWQWLTLRIAINAWRESGDAVSAASTDFLLYSGHVTLAQHWLKMEAAAVKALAAPEAERAEAPNFYEAKRQTSAYVFERLLPRTRSHYSACLAPTASLMAMKADDFAFD